MVIGIPKETKNNECRISLVPDAVATLAGAGHKVCVERGAGSGDGFLYTAYEKAGADIIDGVYDCTMIVRVKEPPLDTIKEKQTIMAYLHIEKGQNPELLNKLTEKKVLSYAYEEIKNEKGYPLVKVILKYDGEGNSVISGLRRLSKPGRRLYEKASSLPKVLGGYGIVLVSTSKGIMTDRKCREENLGGEILCEIW